MGLFKAGQVEDAKRVVKMACGLDPDLRLVVLGHPGLDGVGLHLARRCYIVAANGLFCAWLRQLGTSNLKLMLVSARLKWIIALATLAPLHADARLGETLEQCIARYGPEQRLERSEFKLYRKSKIVAFSRGGMRIVAEIVDGKTAAIVFAREDRTKVSLTGGNDEANTQPLAESEIAKLLSASSNSKHWKRLRTPSTQMAWATADGTLMASYSTQTGRLLITNSETMRTWSARNQNAENADLSGF